MHINGDTQHTHRRARAWRINTHPHRYVYRSTHTYTWASKMKHDGRSAAFSQMQDLQKKRKEALFIIFVVRLFFEEPRPKWDRERQRDIERPVVPAAKLESRIGEAGASCPVFEFRIELYRWERACTYVNAIYSHRANTGLSLSPTYVEPCPFVG